MLSIMKKRWIAVFLIICLGLGMASCTGRQEDTKPPSAPLLTVSSVSKDGVVLAWSESYDDRGIDEYRLYRDDEVLAKVSKTQYTDKDVEVGRQYVYYVVAYDEAGNKSSKSVKQNVTIKDDQQPDPGPSSGRTASIDLYQIAKSTVRLYVLDDDFYIIGTGSGTIINKDGYILTNYHCVGESSGLYNSDGYVAIAFTDDVRQNSQPQYFAQYRYGVDYLDLAVVKIVMDINGNEVSGKDLNLSPITLGDSDALSMGDGVNILGYPGVGGDTITFTAGKISGFLDEDYDNETDWIKTDAFINHGNSGGTAINEKGEMIGIPTAKNVDVDSDLMFLLKPVNLAYPIIEKALAQGDDVTLPQPPVDPDPWPGDSTNVIDIYGRIVDSYTGAPISDAFFIILQPGVTCDDFYTYMEESMVASVGETDYDGLFYCYGLPAGNSYSVIVAAENYYPIMVDDALYIWEEETEPVDLGDISLDPAE